MKDQETSLQIYSLFYLSKIFFILDAKIVCKIILNIFFTESKKMFYSELTQIMQHHVYILLPIEHLYPKNNACL